MKYIIIGNAAVFLLDQFSNGTCSQLMGFWPGLILQGQIWRLVTFLIVPEPMQAIWFIVSLFFYYFLGTTMEREWGTAKFTLFYLSGAVFTVISGFIGGFFMGDAQYLLGTPTVTMGSVNFSIFLAFATLYPDAQIRIYFILPVKAKWLAIFYVLFTAWNIFSVGYLRLTLPYTLPPAAAALINYAIFFWSDIIRVSGRLRRQAVHRTSAQTMNYRAAKKHVKEKKGYLHKCAVCGRTDTDHPELEFRYCSKCNGYYCYCMDHINNHVHVE
jgi:membrane associated rhomboid family serine protease